jgi:hypothetical protein
MSRRSPARRALARSRSSRRGRAGSRLRNAPARNGKPRDTVEQVGHPQELVIRIDKPWGDTHDRRWPKGRAIRGLYVGHPCQAILTKRAHSGGAGRIGHATGQGLVSVGRDFASTDEEIGADPPHRRSGGRRGRPKRENHAVLSGIQWHPVDLTDCAASRHSVQEGPNACHRPGRTSPPGARIERPRSLA